MNIKDILKKKQDIDVMTKDFNLKKKRIEDLVKKGKENGDKINSICDSILVLLEPYKNDLYFIDIFDKINKIKDILVGK